MLHTIGHAACENTNNLWLCTQKHITHRSSGALTQINAKTNRKRIKMAVDPEVLQMMKKEYNTNKNKESAIEFFVQNNITKA